MPGNRPDIKPNTQFAKQQKEEGKQALRRLQLKAKDPQLWAENPELWYKINQYVWEVAYGKPKQQISGDPDAPIRIEFKVKERLPYVVEAIPYLLPEGE